MFYHPYDIRACIDAGNINFTVGFFIDTKDLIGEGLADGSDALKVKNDIGKFLDAGQKAFRLRAGHQETAFKLHQAYGDFRFAKTNIFCMDIEHFLGGTF